MRAMVYEHCKKLLENLILLASAQEGQNIARMLLGYRSNISDTLKLIAEDREGPGILGNYDVVQYNTAISTISHLSDFPLYKLIRFYSLSA